MEKPQDRVLIQFARIFGQTSPEARARPRTTAQWRKVLRRVLHELASYIDSNVDTDPIHEAMLHGALCAADLALDSGVERDLWAGYTEAITRIAFLLLGDYPDHRARSRGAKRSDHYSLKRFRSAIFHQDAEQRYRHIYAARHLGFLEQNPRDAYSQYRRSTPRPSHKGFVRWFREHFPVDHAKVV